MSNDAPLDSEIQKRRESIEDIIGSFRIEGLEFDSVSMAQFERYVVGEISSQDLIKIVQASKP